VRYRVDPLRESWTDPRLQTDGCGRRLVEALSALVDPTDDELAAFTATFGPVFVNGAVDLERVRMAAFLEAHSPTDDPESSEYLTAFAGAIPSDTREGIVEQVGILRDTIAMLDTLTGGGLRGYEARADLVSDWLETGRGDATGSARLALGHMYRTLSDKEASADDLRGSLRRVLAEVIDAHLSGVRVGVAVDKSGRFGIALRLDSLIDAAYWQLLEHVRRRPTRSRASYEGQGDPVFRLPWCGVCGGVILTTRIEDERVNKWHSGCKAAGHARRHRERRRHHETAG
jgi:hypothetical protein